MNRQIFRQALTEVSTTRKESLGAIRQDSNKFYKYVMLRNATATVAGVAGDPVIYAEGVTLQGYVNNRVVTDSTDGDTQPTGAGFLLASVAGVAGTAYYLWIQLTGIVTVPLAVTSGVVGSGVMPTTSGGTDKTLVVATGVINQMGTLLTATGTNNKVLASCQW